MNPNPSGVVLNCRVVLIGDSSVGKTSLLNQLVDKSFNSFEQSTVGANYQLFISNVEGVRVEMQIWDTAGQEKYRSLGPIYFRNSLGALIVFDRSARKSFESIEDWLQAFTQIAGQDTLIAIVGNKKDLPDPQVSTAEAQEWAESRGYIYFETSAKTGENVPELFQSVAKNIVQLRSNAKKVTPRLKQNESKPCSC